MEAANTQDRQQPTTSSQPAAAEGVVLKVAFLADDSTAARWWLSLLQQSPGIDVAFLWAQRRKTAEALHRSAEGASLPASRVVWAEDGGSPSSRKSLKALAQAQAVGSFIVALSPEHHADALETLFSVPEGLQKHVFSCTPPTLCSQRMQRLLQQQQRQQPHGLWSVCSCFTHEVAATKTKAILLDLGQLVAAQLTCTSLLQNQAVAECGNAASLLKQGNVAELMKGSYCSFLSLLRDLFGEVASLSAVQSGDAGTLASHLQFERGPSVSVVVDLNSPTCSFELVAWGVKGHAKLQWDCERKAFEVHRFLQHYEHPTLHPVTGPTWALKDWARAIVGEGVERVAQPLPCAAANFLVDLVVLHSLLESRGSTVALKGLCLPPCLQNQSRKAAQVRR